MPALQVREFPADLYERLKERARCEYRSVAQQTIAAVDWYLRDCDALAAKQEAQRREREEIAEQRRKLFAELNAMPPIVLPEGFPSAAELIREDRDSR